MIVDMPDAEPWQAEVRTGKLLRLEAYGQDAGGERCDINGVHLHWVPRPPRGPTRAFASPKATLALRIGGDQNGATKVSLRSKKSEEKALGRRFVRCSI